MRMAEMKFKSKYRQAAVSGFKSFELITQHMETDGIQVRQMNIREVFEYIEQAGKYGIVPGLDSIRALCGKMGNPQKELRKIPVSCPFRIQGTHTDKRQTDYKKSAL